MTVQLLDGQACATPAGVNPYVSYVNSQAATQTTGLTVGSVVASPLVPVSGSYAIVVPGRAAAAMGAQRSRRMRILCRRWKACWQN